MKDRLRKAIGGTRVTPAMLIYELGRIDEFVVNGRNGILESTDYLRPVLVTGTLVFLGTALEAMNALCELEPRYKKIRKRFLKPLEEWKNARDDVAHYVDRAFRDRPRRDSIGSFNTAQIAVTTIDPMDNDILIQTGQLKPLLLNLALRQMELMLAEVRSELAQAVENDNAQ